MSKAIQYSIEREQFGKSIGEFTAMQYKIGEMARKIFSAESAVYRTGRNIDLKEKELKENKIPENEIKLKGLREYAIECSLMKVYASEVLDYCVDESLQIHGGMGYSVETKVEMGYRDARITRIYEGTNEINRMLSFGELMKRGFHTKEIDLKSFTQKIPFQIFKSALGVQEKSSSQYLENFKYLFFTLTKYATDAYGRALEHEQEIIMDLADILAEIYVLESTYLRVEKLKTKESKDAAFKMKQNICDLQFYEANSKIIQRATSIFDSLPKSHSSLKRVIKSLAIKDKVNPMVLRRKIAKYLIASKEYSL